jgi:3-oxoacyl-[acyl-carrier protein] reductase
MAETAQADALDEGAVDARADAVAAQAGGIDIAFNAIFNDDVQGTPLAELSLEQFTRPISKAMRNQFLTARAVARHMTSRGSGVILTITGGDREAVPSLGATLVTWAAIEAQCRQWGLRAGAAGRARGVAAHHRAAGDHPDTGDAVADLGTGFGQGMTRADIDGMREQTMLKRLPTLAELGNAAAFLASDRASAMTATLANITCGAFLD